MNYSRQIVVIYQLKNFCLEKFKSQIIMFSNDNFRFLWVLYRCVCKNASVIIICEYQLIASD